MKIHDMIHNMAFHMAFRHSKLPNLNCSGCRKLAFCPLNFQSSALRLAYKLIIIGEREMAKKFIKFHDIHTANEEEKEPESN